MEGISPIVPGPTSGQLDLNLQTQPQLSNNNRGLLYSHTEIWLYAFLADNSVMSEKTLILHKSLWRLETNNENEEKHEKNVDRYTVKNTGKFPFIIEYRFRV